MTGDHDRTIDELLDRAVEAINRGDRETARSLAKRVLAVDQENPEVEDLLTAPTQGGQLRRLTLFFCDLVDSTVLSTRLEPEPYRTIVGRYREQVQRIVAKYEGHIGSTKGDGLMVVFGHPQAHENDARRAVQAGLDITRDVARLSEQTRRRFGVEVSVRVGVHRGAVYLDTRQDDVYGFAANLTARVSGLAPPGTVVVSDAIEPLIRDHFELLTLREQPVKGVEGLVAHHQVLGEWAAPTRIPLGPLVGRDEELSYLRSSWRSAEFGTLETSGVAMFGEAGIGKSRLATAVADLAEESGAVILPLLGSPFHTAAGLHPVRTLIERRCGIGRSTGQADRLRLLDAELGKQSLDSERLLPLLAPVLGIAAEHGYQAVHAEGMKLYEEIAEGIQEYLVACLGDGPGLILAEDLHWFDPSTMDVLDELLKTDLRRLLIVLTGRDDTKLPNMANVRLFDLKPLSDNETDELIAALDPQLSADVRAAVRRRCDGVPLYVEEVVNGLGHLTAHDQRSGQVPDALYESLVSRLRAKENTIPVAGAAATIGREFDRGLLLAVVDMPEPEVNDVIGALEDALVLESVNDEVCRFRHELQREVAYELAPPTVRQTLHGRVADTLVGGHRGDAPDWRLVAVHYDKAERFDDAARAYQQAAADARRRGAPDESRAFLSNAIEQLERAPHTAARDHREIQLRLRRGFLASAVEGTASEQSAVDFERCLELVGTEPTEEFFITMAPLYGYYATRGDLRRAEKVLRSVRASLTDEMDWFRPNNDAGLAMLAWYRGQFPESAEALQSAADRSDVSAVEHDTHWFTPNEPIASIYTHLAAARLMIGDFAGAQAEFARAAGRCERLGFPQGPYSHAYSRSYETWMYMDAGLLDRAADVVGALAEQAERHGFEAWVMIAATQHAAVAALSAITEDPLDTDDLEEHIGMMSMFAEAWREAEVKMFLTFYDAVLARVLLAAGRTEEARERLDAALELAADTDVHFYDAELLRLRAHTDSDDEARAAGLRAALDLAGRQGALIFELRSAVDLVAHDGDTSAVQSVVDRFPGDSAWPELTAARALLG